MIRGLLRPALFVCALGLFTVGAAPKASAQDANDLHLSTFFGLGFGGSWNLEETSFDGDLDTTVGFGLRLDVPVLDYLTVGGQVGFNFPKAEPRDYRETWIDLPDLIVRGRYPLQLGPGVLEPYVAFLIGGTISIFGENNIKDTAYGWNVGVRLGAQYFFSDRFGALFEIGWQRHAASHSFEVSGLEFNAAYSANQAVMNLGVSVLF
jgi:hypothetical protein